MRAHRSSAPATRSTAGPPRAAWLILIGASLAAAPALAQPPAGSTGKAEPSVPAAKAEEKASPAGKADDKSAAVKGDEKIVPAKADEKPSAAGRTAVPDARRGASKPLSAKVPSVDEDQVKIR